jgi:hypothetical protein
VVPAVEVPAVEVPAADATGPVPPMGLLTSSVALVVGSLSMFLAGVAVAWPSDSNLKGIDVACGLSLLAYAVWWVQRSRDPDRAAYSRWLLRITAVAAVLVAGYAVTQVTYWDVTVVLDLAFGFWFLAGLVLLAAAMWAFPQPVRGRRPADRLELWTGLGTVAGFVGSGFVTSSDRVGAAAVMTVWMAAFGVLLVSLGLIGLGAVTSEPAADPATDRATSLEYAVGLATAAVLVILEGLMVWGSGDLRYVWLGLALMAYGGFLVVRAVGSAADQPVGRALRAFAGVATIATAVVVVPVSLAGYPEDGRSVVAVLGVATGGALAAAATTASAPVRWVEVAAALATLLYGVLIGAGVPQAELLAPITWVWLPIVAVTTALLVLVPRRPAGAELE